MTESRFQEDVQLAFRQANGFREALEEIAAMECQHGSGTRSWPCPVCTARRALKPFPAP